MPKARRELRLTWHLQAVLAVFLSQPGEELYGLEIATKAGILGGTMYPLLARLEQAGWLTSRWEDLDETAAGRRRRRYYRLTADGERSARTILAAQSSGHLRPANLGWISC
jgi:PadR family transcriptional regulator, regulatory protein PadR